MATPVVKESFRERQIHELEVIKAIFANDVEVLRPSCDTDTPAAQWKPTEIRISLTPLRDSSNGHTEAYARTKLHIICPSKYPKIAPKILIEESKGLSDQLVEELLQKLQQQSEELRGEVMIYELAQTVQSFLLKYNKPPRGSFYDEMLQENQKREQERLDKQKRKENLERQTLIEEVERRKEMFKSEAKRRSGETRRSMSESNYHASSSESSENSSPYYRSHCYPNKCLEHRNSEKLYFHRVGRQVQRGCCLGHSQKGCVAYTGIDLDSGQLLYVTEWTIKYSQLEQKCGNGGHCYWIATEPKCGGNHRVEDVIASIEKQVTTLSQLHHKNLIQYECVLCIKRKEGLIVYLVQDFLLGTSLLNISSSLGWCIEGVRMVARGVLDALVFLHNKGVSHSHLMDSTVFMDNTGTLRCTDFSLVPNLLELVGGIGQRSVQGDLPAFGALIESLMSTHTYEMRDFIDKCNSDRTLSASELLDHPFLHSSLLSHDDKANAQLALALTQKMPRRISGGTPGAALQNAKPQDRHERQQQHLPASLSVMPVMPVSQSRLRNEFEVLTYLGKGAFGDVLKVRNILDNRQYALKRIPLSARSRQLYKKMTREVELLSRLNHENVVRYFNSWIESVTEADEAEMDKLLGDELSGSNDISYKPTKSSQLGLPVKVGDESSSSMWSGCVPNADDSDSDGIEFVDSNGEIVNYDDDDDDDEEEESSRQVSKGGNAPKPMQVMYIQMEFCEKCTLRTAIDDNLYEDTERLWRLFREIAEGLSHIHQQGIIHRDLKPVNIFLDTHDQIKIGDFGLATTSFLALQSQHEQTNQQSMQVASIEDGTGTGKVGTTLYVAPELTGNASKSTYGQKVDMYTLGIILFEMSQPPFETGMERVQTIVALRTAAIVIPENMLSDNRYEKTVKILRWLLNHEPAQRPTAEELLSSDLVPPAQLEANELQEMLRHALANPQSKAYKHLVARCLQQQSDELLEYTYHFGSSRNMKSWNAPISLDGFVSLNPIFECVKAKVVGLFRKHGGIEVDTPLLSPLSKRTNPWNNPVRLMTHSGCVVVLPSDLRTEFARHIAMNGVNMMRRYCVDRVYREEKVFNFHPKQSYECAFDIITPYASSPIVDAELLALAFEITNEIPRLREKNMRIRMNHTQLLRAILLYCNVPKSSYTELFANIADYIEGRISKFQFHSGVTVIMEKSRSSATALIELLLANFLMSGTRSSVDDSSLKSLIRGKGETASLAKSALRELETVVSLAHSLGVTCPIHIFAGLPISYDRASSGGVVWQLIADLKPNRSAHSSVLAMGERYDTLLNEFQKQAQGFNQNIPARVISGVGLSFWLDKLVGALDMDYMKDCRAIDVAVCVNGTRAPLKYVTDIMRLLWSANIRCYVVESATGAGDEARDLAKLGALHIILVAENGALRISSWERDRFQERHVTRAELVDFIRKLRTELGNANAIDYVSQLSNSSAGGNAGYSGSGGGGSSGGGGGGNYGRGDYSLSTSASNASIKSSYNPSQWPNVQVVFVVHDKLTANLRRRYENQVTQQMSVTLSQFMKKESVIVLVVELPPVTVNAIVGAINPREADKKETEVEINNVIERFPKFKRYITEITDEIIDYLTGDKATVVALYTISDSYYRIII
ncbi:eIF-2-alpha kinase GCN2 [Bactrocera tryoni]|uniref:eIF-2-alpha kinase GCN2 n=1 Tax=Bactrocera tryoni TaxID=59916 RepID=UPI001A968A85|nr:eIF-2-alpha kinase GCN2 [Bactrocera tryoni]